MIELLVIAGAKVSLTGSSVVPGCEPRDTDWLVDCSMPFGRKKIFNAVERELTAAGYWKGMPASEKSGSLLTVPARHYDSRMTVWSHHKDKNQFIVTRDRKMAEKWRFATDLCAALRLTNKQDRVCLFKAVVYGEIENPKEALL